MTSVWWTIAMLMVGTVAIKSAGPVTLGHREPPPRLRSIIALLTPALLSALVVHETFAMSGGGVAVDPRLVGLLVAAVALARRLPLLAVVVLAGASTALGRLLS